MNKKSAASQSEMIDEVEQMVVKASRQSDDLARRMTDNLANVWVNLQFDAEPSDAPVTSEYGDYDGNESVAA